ncbi:MAG: efflux RND transporter permease subunit, partial [Pseudomonadota bacterium]
MPGGIIAWFAQNPVAANLLMIFIMVAGVMSYLTIQKQMFPNIEINYINAHVSYPGASPKEIEENIVKKIEENIKDITEIEKSVGRSWRSGGRVTMEIDPDVHLPDVLNKIKARIDGIATFPAAMEPVKVAQLEWDQEVIEMTLAADMDLQTLKPIAKQIEQELLQLHHVQIVEADVPDDEIAIEVIPEMLRKYDLSINDVTQAIRRFSANYSAGQIRSDAGTIEVRIENQYYSGNEFRHIPVKVGDNGAKVLIQDIAIIKDQFTEGERYFKYNGENAIYLKVAATKSQNIIPVAKSVKAYIEERNKTLPQGVDLNVMVDMTYYLNGRLNMMLRNLAQGAILVFLMLAIFLRFKLAFWVMVGLPVCFLGAIAMMSVVGISINIISLFAFIMVLGIVVDDAIVIGESAYTEIEKNGMSSRNVVIGAKKVAMPATFGVLTTIAAFAPFMMSSGPQGDFFINIAGVVVLCLIFSLIESKLILPAHIAHTTFKPLPEKSWRHRFNQAFLGLVHGTYRRFIVRCTDYRWPTLAVFIGMLVISGFFISSNLVRQVDEPRVPHDFPRISLQMSETVSDETVINALKTIKNVVMQVEKDIVDEYGSGMIRDIMVWNEFDNSGTVMTPLVDEELRPFNTFELARRWREAMPEVPGMRSFSVQDDVTDDGIDDGEFGYLIFGSDIVQLNQAGRYLIERLQQEKGLYDISSTIDPASKELQLSLKPVAYDLGLDLNLLASQVGASFYGGEAQRILRNGEEVRVMVRYPKLTRERYADLKHTVIQTPTGAEVLLGDVAEFTEVPGISYIRREGGYRSVYI